MRYILVLVLLFCYSFSSNQPSWFYNIKAKNNQIIGYGVSNNLAQAKKEALNEIAFVISTKVDSFLQIDKIYNKNGVKRDVKKSIKTSTNVKIEDVEILKSSYIDDKWYIAISFDYSPFATKFKKLLSNYKLKNEYQNSYLSNTNLIKSLNIAIGKRLNYNLYNKDGIWYLAYKDKSLKLSEKDFYNLFTFINSPTIDLNINKENIYSNEEININIKSKHKGYISLLYVNSYGDVGVIKDNIAIIDKLIYPTTNKLIVKNISNKDKNFMIVAIYSKTKIDLKEFDKISDKRIKNYDFPKLLKFLEKYDYATFIAKVFHK